MNHYIMQFAACASNFPNYAADYGLVVPNGSYAIAASHCVQCSCGQGSRKWVNNFTYMHITPFLEKRLTTSYLDSCSLYCMPASLAVSCSSMQCPNSNLMIGNSTVQQSSAGCNVTSCSYGGLVNGSISAMYAFRLILSSRPIFSRLKKISCCRKLVGVSSFLLLT